MTILRKPPLPDVQFSARFGCARTPLIPESTGSVVVQHRHSSLGELTVRLTASAGGLDVRISLPFDDTRDDSKARESLRSLLPRIVDGLAVHGHILANPVERVEDTFDQVRKEAEWRASAEYDPSVVRGVVQAMLGTVTVVATATVQTGFDDGFPIIETLRLNLPRHLDRDDAIIRAFRAAKEAKDPVARYMFLYAVVLMLSASSGKEEQKYADKLIKRHSPAVVMRPRHHGKGHETLYTSLRNDLGHAGDRQRPLDEVEKEIIANVFALERIVQQAIKEYVVAWK